MKVSDLIAEKLAATGVRYFSGIPGGPSIPYMEAFRKAGIDFILTSEERSAAFMADVTYRLTGILGVCHGTFGPGATNLLTGIGSALLDRSAVIALTSEMSDEWLRRMVQMNIDHQALFRPVVKATYRITSTNAKSVMSSAISLSLREYPGPVHIGLPTGVSEKEAGNQADEEASLKPGENLPGDRDESIKLLGKCKNPVIALGLTSARLRLGNAVKELLKTFRVPVLLTPMAKGLIDENHPCYAGVLFHSLSDHLRDIYEKADLVIGLGYDPVEYNYESWIPQVPLIHFDTVKTDLPAGNNVFSFTGPPAQWFKILGTLNLTSGIISSGIVNDTTKRIESIFESFTSHFGPVTALKVLRDSLPASTVITADVGSHLHLIGQYWKTCGLQNLIITNGWSSMGFGIPSAIAAKLCRPSSEVVCITGDGGFLMSAGEIVTAVRYKIPVIIVVFSDGELNLIKIKQSWQNLPPYGTEIIRGTLFEGGRFLGAEVINAGSAGSLKEAIRRAMKKNTPIIINAMIDPDDYNRLIVRQ